MGLGRMWLGGTEDQMGPLNFFILCGYIVHVYMNIAITNFLLERLFLNNVG